MDERSRGEASFRLVSHTADVGVEATGPDHPLVFAAVADGLAAAMCDDVPTTGGERFAVSVAGENREALLFEYLDELIYERDVRSVLPVDNLVETIARTAAGWELSASARGVPLEAIEAREIKAVTYSEMTIEETDDGWRVYVVFDV